MKRIIAIVNPLKNAYSETFIEAHKKLLNGQIHYLYGGQVPIWSEFTEKKIIPSTVVGQICYNISFILFNSGLNRSQYALRRYLKKYKVQAVLAEYGTSGAQVYDVCSQLKIPLIVHFHGNDASVYKILESNKVAYKKMFVAASYIIGVSNAMIEKLKMLGADRRKLIYTVCGPNDAFLNLELKQNKSLQFFCVGRFVDKKAPYYTLFAFKKVLKKHPKARLVFGGDGPLLESSIHLTRILNIDHRVEFKGIMEPKKVKEYMSDSTAYIQHSIKALTGDMEGTPVGIMEASAAGLPVISTFHAGIPDVIIHKKTGLLCQEHDYLEMANHMIWILDHPNEAFKMGVAGRENIKRNFTLKKHIDIIDNIIEKSIIGYNK